MIRKILQVGTSAAVTLPKHILEFLGVGVGDQINVHVDADKQQVTIQPVSSKKLSQSEQEILEIARDFSKRYKKDLDELARM